MFATLLLLAVVGQAISATTSDFVLHEKRSNANLNGKKRVDADAILPIRIALTQRNLENGYEYLLDLSDPRYDTPCY
jgi:tripeptidyl-peptidase-1